MERPSRGSIRPTEPPESSRASPESNRASPSSSSSSSCLLLPPQVNPRGCPWPRSRVPPRRRTTFEHPAGFWVRAPRSPGCLDHPSLAPRRCEGPSRRARDHGPSPIAHRPSPIARRPHPPSPPSPIAHRPSLIDHRLSPIVHRPSPGPIAARPSRPPPPSGWELAPSGAFFSPRPSRGDFRGRTRGKRVRSEGGGTQENG